MIWSYFLEVVYLGFFFSLISFYLIMCNNEVALLDILFETNEADSKKWNSGW